MRNLWMLVVAGALLAPVALAQEQPEEEPVVGEPVDEDPFVGEDPFAGEPDAEPGAGQEQVGPQDPSGEAGAPFGLAWWAWLLVALVVIGLIAAIAVAMGTRDREATTVIEREYRRPPP